MTDLWWVGDLNAIAEKKLTPGGFRKRGQPKETLDSGERVEAGHRVT